jgi:hypothetical protein
VRTTSFIVSAKIDMGGGGMGGGELGKGADVAAQPASASAAMGITRRFMCSTLRPMGQAM